MAGELRDLPNLRGRFPFRLGATSYVIPADIVPNVRELAVKVDDVELVLFESAETSNLPDAETVGELRRLAAEHDLSYTVHLPLDARLGERDERARRRAVEKCLAVADCVRALGPLAWTVHFDADGPGRPAPADARAWRAALARSARELIDSGIEPRRLCVETLDYPFEAVEEVVAGLDLSICLDVGHLLISGRPLEAALVRYLPRCRVVHLHGVINGKDHADLSGMPRADLGLLVALLGAGGEPPRVVTLEVFSAADLARSLAILGELAA